MLVYSVLRYVGGLHKPTLSLHYWQIDFQDIRVFQRNNGVIHWLSSSFEMVLIMKTGSFNGENCEF